MTTSCRVRTGCERLLDQAEVLHGRPYGLLAHGASVTADCRPLHLALAASTAGPPVALFGPEHGFYGVEQDMVASQHEDDPWTGAPILSLYGDDEASLRPSPTAFEGLDVLLVDVQDVGSRYYTYIATAIWAARAALEAGVEVWILDRPNPLGGTVVEGNRIAPPFDSFVGAFDTPVRHGLTLGEMVALEAQRQAWPDGWRVWNMDGWQRSMLFSDTGLPWVAPSPNMPTLDTALVYPGMCLVEGTALSEGRGTTRPFQLVGGPGVRPHELVQGLEAHAPRGGLDGVDVLPTYFKPQFQKHAGAACGGIQLVVRDADGVSGYRLGVELLFALARHLGMAESEGGFAWRRAAYEFVTDIPAIDLLTGGETFRHVVESGDRDDLDAWIRSWKDDEQEFERQRQSILLYS